MATDAEEETPGQGEETEVEEKHEEHSGLTLDGLADKVDALADTVKNALKGRPRSTSTQADQSEAVAAQVREEVGKIKADDDKRKTVSDRVSAVEQKVKEIVEKAPVEYRRVTRVLWGDPDE